MLNDQNEYSSVAYSPSGRKFVLAGLQPHLEIYDEERLKLMNLLSKDVEKRHTNKIFTAKFFPDSENLIYSGGWDRNVKFWDLRGNKLTLNVFGP